MRIAILDDYQGCSLEMADWSIPGAEVQAFRDHLTGETAIAARLRGFDVVVVMRERTPFPRGLIERLPDLRLLVTTGRLNRAIDVAAARERGIVVCGTRSMAGTTTELTWGLILAVIRSIPREDALVRAGGWQATLGIALRGKTLGVAGLGNIGREVATVGRAFGMEVIAWSQNLTLERARQAGATLVTKDELLARSDVVTIHLVLSERTRGLLGARELALLKPAAYLVNTSRGPIIDERALIDALSAGRIAGAGLDVFDVEPLPLGHPFRKLDNVVVTPHLGYVTRESYDIFWRDAIEDILAYRAGAPIRVVEPAV